METASSLRQRLGPTEKEGTMPDTRKSSGEVRRRGGKDRAHQKVVQSANGHIVSHYPFGCLGGTPHRLVGQSNFWIVPVFLTSPGYGAVGEVGWVAVDARSHQ